MESVDHFNQLGAAVIRAAHENRRQYDVTPADYPKLQARMTNWQRNQWAKAGYRKADIPKFAFMLRPIER